MKKVIIILSAVFAILGCQQKEKGYSISATTEGFEDGAPVYINAISQSNRPTIIDSTTIQNGKFTISLEKTETLDFNYITIKDAPGNVLFLPENHPIEMTVYKDSLRSSVVKGGPENELFFSYLDKLKKLNQRKIDIRKEQQAISKVGESEKVKELSKEVLAISEEEKSFRKQLAADHPNSIVAIMALSDLMNLKAIPAKEAKAMYGSFRDTLKTTRLGKNLDRLIAASIGKIDVGSEAEDFSAPTPDGKLLSLKDAMGKITIIDFWASWCKPCRAENPNVVRIYNKYHDKGLNIIGVSLDRKKEQWTAAIDQDNLEWNHVSNLKFWQDPVAKSYGVRSIPATFILDEKGNVIAKNLRGPALESKISELLGTAEEAL